MDNESFGEQEGTVRPSRDAAAPGFGQTGGQAPARMVRLISGDFLLTVNPVDGSEVELCPPGGTPDGLSRLTTAVRRSNTERIEHERIGRPPALAGPATPRLPLLERDEERERLIRMLARGRSIRVTGAAGSGRTTLLNAVAAECADLAPDGVVRLNGRQRTPSDLLNDLFNAIHTTPQLRPDRNQLLSHIREIGAIVVLDDLDFGGAALDELLNAAPECAFLTATTPEVPGPTDASRLEEVTLVGLGRPASLELLKRAVDRPLTEDEQNWAGDLWFESEGLPLRFVQAGALLRQCDALRQEIQELQEDPDAFEAFARIDATGGEVPLPTLGQGAAPAALLASRLSESARNTLRFAVALGGEVPHQAHLPALIGDTHADTAIGELMRCGLLSPVGGRYRLAAGVLVQLTERGYADEAAAHARTTAQHYAWWTAHPSVTPERAVAEADAIVAALTALVPGTEAADASAAVLLARSAAPAFAAGLYWGGWERVLRVGSEAARIAGEVAEEAYFHHELGVLALCTDSLDRARAELEASIAMRGALADKRGTVAGRRALALVADRENGLVPSAIPAPVPPPVPAPELEVAAPELELPQGRTALALPAGQAVAPPELAHERAPGDTRDERDEQPEPRTQETAVIPETLVASQAPPPYSFDRREPRSAPGKRFAVLRGARRNLVAAGAGAVIVALLGTVLTLGMAGDGEEQPSVNVRNGQSANVDDEQDGLQADEPDTEPADDPDDPDAPTSPLPDSSDEVDPDPTSSRTSESSRPSESSGSTGFPGSSEGPSSSGSQEPGESPSSSQSTRPTSRPTSAPPTSRPPTGPSNPGEPSSSQSSTGSSTPRPSTSGGVTASAPISSAPVSGSPSSASAPAGPGGVSPSLA
ncbi:ATP-binding protein [Streptomyces sp. NPDC059256]|uniref:ATP-binding protein n=1 Tax=Streptomyces sp. NPDC059256 TaxID=3346794 RepID=UPI0036A0D73B